MRTGVILDHNQRPVPDGTVVRFAVLQGESGLLQQMDVVTSQGVALASYRLEKSGLIEIHASSEPARISDTIQLDVTSEGAAVIIITPTSEATAIPTLTPTLEPPTPTPVVPVAMTLSGYPNLIGWFLITLALFAGAGLMFWVGGQIMEPRWAIRWALLVFLGGVLAYNYLIFSFPGGDYWLDGRGLPAYLQAVLIGQGVGFVVGWLWRSTSESGNQAQEQQNH
jgi:hypothetical protein